MAIKLTREFICDLQSVTDPNFARRVFTKLFDERGNFRSDANDHRYRGIDDSWIRYVSQGSSAFRVIYIRKGADVFIYRAGPHSVENKLAAAGLSDIAAEVDGLSANNRGEEGDDLGRFICSLRTPYLYSLVLGRALIPHKEVILVSPFISMSLLGRTAKLGRMLDRLREDGASVTIITRPPAIAEWDRYVDLESRGMNLLFHERLHAKVYMFEVDQSRLGYGRQASDLYILGSANLTESGYGATREDGNEELSYELPHDERVFLDHFVHHLALRSADLMDLKRGLNRINRTQ